MGICGSKYQAHSFDMGGKVGLNVLLERSWMVCEDRLKHFGIFGNPFAQMFIYRMFLDLYQLDIVDEQKRNRKILRTLRQSQWKIVETIQKLKKLDAMLPKDEKKPDEIPELVSLESFVVLPHNFQSFFKKISGSRSQPYLGEILLMDAVHRIENGAKLRPVINLLHQMKLWIENGHIWVIDLKRFLFEKKIIVFLVFMCFCEDYRIQLAALSLCLSLGGIGDVDQNELESFLSHLYFCVPFHVSVSRIYYSCDSVTFADILNLLKDELVEMEKGIRVVDYPTQDLEEKLNKLISTEPFLGNVWVKFCGFSIKEAFMETDAFQKAYSSLLEEWKISYPKFYPFKDEIRRAIENEAFNNNLEELTSKEIISSVLSSPKVRTIIFELVKGDFFSSSKAYPIITVRQKIKHPAWTAMRVFIRSEVIRAISQTHADCFFPMCTEKDYNNLVLDVMRLFEEKIQGQIRLHTYAFDCCRCSNSGKIIVLEFFPISQAHLDFCLFSKTDDSKLLFHKTSHPGKFRYVSSDGVVTKSLKEISQSQSNV